MNQMSQMNFSHKIKKIFFPHFTDKKNQRPTVGKAKAKTRTQVSHDS